MITKGQPRIVIRPAPLSSGSVALPDRTSRRPKQKRYQRWRPTRVDGSAFFQAGIGWIVRSGCAWKFLPIDGSRAVVRGSLSEAIAAGNQFGARV